MSALLTFFSFCSPPQIQAGRLRYQRWDAASHCAPVPLTRLSAPFIFSLPSVICVAFLHSSIQCSLNGSNAYYTHFAFPLLSLWQMPSPFGASQGHEKKIGHRRVDASGETTYKKVDFFLFFAFMSQILLVGFCGITISAVFYPHLCSIVLFFVVRLQTTSSALKGAIQLGIGYTVGNLSSKPERDVLMQDFYVVESIFFPRCI